jgi:DNA-binding NarL/FixJ family response regulator
VDEFAAPIDNDSLDAGTAKGWETILLVGSPLDFPDCLIRLLVAEIDHLVPIRVARPSDVTEDMLGRARLVIVDQSFAEALRAMEPPPARERVVVAFRDERRARRLLAERDDAAPWTSLLPMKAEAAVWLGLVRLVLSGMRFVPPELLADGEDAASETLLPEPAQRAPAGAEARGARSIRRLTARETEVLSLVAAGCMNKQIAARLALSEHTVKLHLHHAMAKLGARNRTDAAMRYAAHCAS